ncbi:MAG: prolyl oligopeptidase family serine peptidase [Clostridium sp.]|nr:prolyl oligopeptidase family serine peptidase [Clostridium sp.]
MKKSILFATLLSTTGIGRADTIRVDRMLHADPIPMAVPLLTDSTDAQGRPYNPQSLLDGFTPANLINQGGPTDGFVVLQASETPTLHMAGFYVENHRYSTGTVRIEGVKDYALLIDGTKQNSLSYTLTPGTHRFEIKALATKDRNDTLRVSLLTEGGETPTVKTDSTRLYTLMDVMKGRRMTGARLSADGRFILMTYTTTRKDGGTASEQKIYDTTTGRVTLCPAGAQWMPDGHRYCHVRSTADGYQLVSTDADDGSEQVVVADLPHEHYTWDNTCNRLFYFTGMEEPRPDADMTEIITPDDRQPGWRRRYNLSMLDRTTGITRPITFGHSLQPSINLSGDGRYLFVCTQETRLTQRPFYLTTIIRMDLQTMQTDTLVQQDGFVSGPVLSPDGNTVLVSGSPEAFGGIGLAVSEGQTPSMYERQLYLINVAQGSITPLTRTFHPAVESYEWCYASNTIYALAAHRDMRKLYAIQPATGQISEIPTQEEYVRSFSTDRTGRWIAYVGESVSNGERLYLTQVKSGKTRLIEDTGSRRLQGIELGECHDYNFINSRGDTIYGRFYLPPHFDSSRRYPLIVNYYGGCTPTARLFESRYPHHAYAALGYVVYVVQPSGTYGFGQEFAARHVNAWGDYTADDIIEGTRRFCADHPYVNEKKIGCIGASYGGFTTQLLQTRTDLFAAAVSHAGISNIASYWGEGYWGYSYSQAATAGNYPWNNPTLYTEHSPLFHADKIHTPLLFLHGTADTNVPIGESIQMFTALKLLGRETAFVTVRGENHQILDFHKRQKWQNTIFAWFARWLQDDPLWWNTLYPPKEL